jgi:hypothetical protein
MSCCVFEFQGCLKGQCKEGTKSEVGGITNLTCDACGRDACGRDACGRDEGQCLNLMVTVGFISPDMDVERWEK